jgi:hypothetical protein
MKRIAAIAILITAACPQDDGGASMPSETGVDPTTTAAPDLPSESSTTQPDTGDGDGDQTSEGDGDGDPTTGDGDGDTTGDGDGDPGDGDGDTGSEAVPASLIVESNGQRIGYLMGVFDYGLVVWDDVNEVTFSVSQQTGNVTGAAGGFYYYTAPACAGQRYTPASYAAQADCEDIPAPTRHNVRGDGGSSSGHIVAPNLVAISGAPLLIMTQSVFLGGNCQVSVAEVCAQPLSVTNVIPKTFALPITVAETLAMP